MVDLSLNTKFDAGLKKNQLSVVDNCGFGDGIRDLKWNQGLIQEDKIWVSHLSESYAHLYTSHFTKDLKAASHILSEQISINNSLFIIPQYEYEIYKKPYVLIKLNQLKILTKSYHILTKFLIKSWPLLSPSISFFFFL